MIGTLFSFALAAFLYYSAMGREVISSMTMMWIVPIIAASIFIALPGIIAALSWSAIVQAEHRLTPRIFELVNKDFSLKFVFTWLLIFPIATFAIVMDLMLFQTINHHIILPVWLVLFGISLDAVHHLIKKIQRYLNPYQVLQYYKNEADYCMKQEKELDLCQWIDTISEISVRAIQRTSISLCNDCNDDLQMIARNFLESSKSIAQHQQDAETRALGIRDKISYTLFFILQRLQMINNKAVEQKLEPVCSNLVTIFGKITIAAAKCDLTLTLEPLRFLGMVTREAQLRRIPEVGHKATCILLEIARVILVEIDITYLELQDPFFSIIDNLDNIAKEMFRQDKSMSIQVLTQPFRDLKELFNSDIARAHQDTPVILIEIDRVLAEYSALEMVMRTIPPIPEIQS